MLVLTRKQKECIKIGDSITITVLRVHGQAVRIGIEAPRDIRVIRGELPASKTEEAEQVNDEQPHIIEFRFTPSASEADSQPHAMTRGPLASLMATLHKSGMVAEAISK